MASIVSWDYKLEKDDAFTQFTAYYRHIRDYEKKRGKLVPVNEETVLTNFYKPSHRLKDDKPLYNRSHQSAPECRSSITFNAGNKMEKCLPGQDIKNFPTLLKGINIDTCFSEIETAPAILLNLLYLKDGHKIVKAMVEIPFSGEKALEDFKLTYTEHFGHVHIVLEFLCNGVFFAGQMKILQSQLPTNQAKGTPSDYELMAQFDRLREGVQREPMRIDMYQFRNPNQEPGKPKHTKPGEEAPPIPNLKLNDNLKQLFQHIPGTSVYGKLRGHVPYSLQSSSADIDILQKKRYDVEKEEILADGQKPVGLMVNLNLPYAAFRNSRGHINLTANQSIKMPHIRMRMGTSMMTMPTPDVFRDISQARVKLSIASDREFAEEACKLAMLCRSSNKHLLRIVNVSGIGVACIKFDKNFAKLNDDAEVPLRLAPYTNVTITFSSPREAWDKKIDGFVISFAIPIPECDLAVVITSHRVGRIQPKTGDRDDGADLCSCDHDTSKQDSYNEDSSTSRRLPIIPQGMCIRYTGTSKQEDIVKNYLDESKTCKIVALTIRPNETLYKNQMICINRLTGTLEHDRWHPYLLNQQPVQLPKTEPLSKPDDFEGKDDDWDDFVNGKIAEILKKYTINEKQAQVFKRLRENSGHIICFGGPAGTGKTTVLKAMIDLQFQLGFHSLNTAPANTNVERLASEVATSLPKIPIVRLTPSANHSGLSSLTGSNPDPIPARGAVSQTLLASYLTNRIEGKKKKFSSTEEFQLQNLVAKYAALRQADDNPFGLHYRTPYRYLKPATDNDTHGDDKQESPDEYAEETCMSNELENKDDESQHSYDSDDDEPKTLNLTKNVDEAESTNIPDASDVSAAMSEPDIPSLKDLESLPDTWPSSVHNSSIILPAVTPAGWQCKELDGQYWYINDASQISSLDPRLRDTPLLLWEECNYWLSLLQQEKGFQAFNDLKDATGKKQRYHLREIFDTCCREILARAPVVFTTSATAYSKLMRTTWTDTAITGKKPRGVFVNADEAFKDTEANFFGPLVVPLWSDSIRAVLACGDKEQLTPVITGTKPMESDANAVLFNPVIDQLSKSFPLRWTNEGGEYIELVEQNRMHRAISKHPNMLIYGGKLQDGANCDNSLETDLPGITRELHAMFRGLGCNPLMFEEEDFRVHSFEVPGVVLKNPATGSKTNIHQITFAIKHLLSPWRNQFGAETRKKCAWIAGYGEQVQRIEHAFLDIQYKNQQWTRDYFPTVITIDGIQGDQYACVLFFSVINDGEEPIGFLNDQRRINVAITRATSVLWFIRGTFEGRHLEKKGRGGGEKPMIARFADRLFNNQCTKVDKAPEIKTGRLPVYLQKKFAPAETSDDSSANNSWGSNGEGTKSDVENNAAASVSDSWGSGDGGDEDIW